MKAPQVVGTLLQGLCARVHPLGAHDGALRAALRESGKRKPTHKLLLEARVNKRARAGGGGAGGGGAQCAHEDLHRHMNSPRGIPPPSCCDSKVVVGRGGFDFA